MKTKVFQLLHQVVDLINKLNNLLELRSKNDIELKVKKEEKRGTREEQENSGYNSSGFDYSKRNTCRIKNSKI